MKNNFFLVILLIVSASLAAQEKSFTAIYKKNTPKNLYGKGQQFIDSIISRMSNAAKSASTSLLITNHPSVYMSNYFSAENVKYYYEMIGRAILSEIDESKYLRKIDSFAQNIRYADIETAAAARSAVAGFREEDKAFVAKNYYDSLIGEFSSKTSYFGLPVLYTNQPTPDEYAEKKKEYFVKGFENHAAVGAKISFKYPYDTKHKAGGNKSLVDGLHGSENSLLYWQGWMDKDLIATIDFGKIKNINSINISFLVLDVIQAPDKVKIEYSADGKRFLQMILKRTESIKKNNTDKYAVALFENSAPNSKPVDSRYIRVTAKDRPAKNSWLLADEIVVK